MKPAIVVHVGPNTIYLHECADLIATLPPNNVNHLMVVRAGERLGNPGKTISNFLEVDPDTLVDTIRWLNQKRLDGHHVHFIFHGYFTWVEETLLKLAIKFKQLGQTKIAWIFWRPSRGGML